MGKVDRLCNRVEPLAGLLWDLGTIQYLTTPDPDRHGPASLHRRTQSMSFNGHISFNSQQRRVAPQPPPFLSRNVIYLCCVLSFLLKYSYFF